MVDPADAAGLPAWLNIVFTLTSIVAAAVLVRLGYRRAPVDEEAPPKPVATIVGGALADTGSMMILAASIDRHAAVIERAVVVAEERWHSEQQRSRDDEIRADVVDDLRRSGRLKD